MDSTHEVQEEINLDFGDYRIIRLDTYNIVVQKKKVRKSGNNIGDVYYETEGYYPTVDTALRKLQRVITNKATIKSLDAVIDAVRKSEDLILSTLREMQSNGFKM